MLYTILSFLNQCNMLFSYYTVAPALSLLSLSLSLLCSSLLGERIYPIDRGSEVRGYGFNVPFREDAKGLPFTDVNVKAALSAQLF